MLEAQRVELALERSRIGLTARDHAGDHFLTPVRMPPPDHRDLGDVAVALQHLLDLTRINVAAAADDEILRAILERQETVAVEASDVSRMQPSAGQRRCGCFRIHPVALHHGGSADENLADLAEG